MEKKEDDDSPPDLEWRDYLALTIAALQTVLLPVVVLMAVLIVLFLLIH